MSQPAARNGRSLHRGKLYLSGLLHAYLESLCQLDVMRGSARHDEMLEDRGERSLGKILISQLSSDLSGKTGKLNLDLLDCRLLGNVHHILS